MTLAVEKQEFDDEDVFDRHPALLCDKLACGFSGTTSGDEIINHDDRLARLDGTNLHLERVCTVFFYIGSGVTGSR